MTASIVLRESENLEQVNVIANITDSIKMANLKHTLVKEVTSDVDYDKMLNLTTLSLKMYSNAYYKTAPSIESTDIEQIKMALKNFTNHSQSVSILKEALIKDLTFFQMKIITDHEQKIIDLKKQLQVYEKQIQMYDAERTKLIMERLYKIAWPYDAKTKNYENKIIALQNQTEKLEQKITDLKQSRPSASEKDILLYQMSLKEKYAHK